MNRFVTQGARLVLSREIVSRTAWTLPGERMTLQAQQIHLHNTQKTWIGGAVWDVTTAAAFRLYRDVLIDKRALLVGVTFEAGSISAG
jgi:hypothetical protein